MKLINSVNETRYKKINTIFISDYKWDFLADKYRITLNTEEWADLEADYISDEDTGVLYGDSDGHSCIGILQSAYNYAEIERLFKYRKVILYTNEDKDFHILVQDEY